MLLVVLAAAVMLAVTEAATTDAPPEPDRCCFDKEFSAVLGSWEACSILPRATWNILM